jgi:hypothetical protein
MTKLQDRGEQVDETGLGDGPLFGLRESVSISEIQVLQSDPPPGTSYPESDQTAHSAENPQSSERNALDDPENGLPAGIKEVIETRGFGNAKLLGMTLR